MRATGCDRTFLFLQGPHGPFFAQLARHLASTGARVLRVGFNGGDAAFWPQGRGAVGRFLPYRGPSEAWPAAIANLLVDEGVTDLVLYGDTRPLHGAAIAAARQRGIEVHVFEEGYLRPYWVTYERGGTNGHSRLMSLAVPEMRAALSAHDHDQPDAPANWGDMRQHMFWGALYHWHVFARARQWPQFRPHRGISVLQEAVLHLRRLIAQPLHRWQRMWATARILRSANPYHLVLMQLEHDASFRSHSPFASMADFAAVVLDGFAEGAAPHHHLVFKAHPLEDDRRAIFKAIRALAAARGLSARVHIIRGGKLAQLLNMARSAVTVNSTAGQQALWRGMPLRTFGAAVYAKPEFVSTQGLAEFFAHPARPDRQAYLDFRCYLLETSQVAGGFYSATGRQALLRQVVDMMLDRHDPYDALRHGAAPPRSHLRLVN